MPQRNENSQRILILVENERKASMPMNAVEETVVRQGYPYLKCSSIEQLGAEIQRGAAVIITVKDDLRGRSLLHLSGCLSRQPSWSHIPLIVLLPEGEEILAYDKSLSALEKLANLNMIESPLRPGHLLQILRSAQVYRKRQYDTRDLMKELERSRHEAVEADRAKSDFLANMSHEIRTPLGAILGFAELLMDNRTSRREKKDYMIAARRNGQMLSALIDDILDLARVESGRLEISKIEFSLGELISEVVSALEPLASKKGLPLTISRPQDGDQIVTDPIRLKQILVNIVGNAIKFTSHGSIQVRIELRPGANDSSDLNVEVEDTGIGISSAQAARLFRPFTQADTSNTRKFGGTGLGLVLSRKLAQALGGDLDLKWSIPGGGSSFGLTLPVKVMRSSRAVFKDKYLPTGPEGKLPLAGSRILLVDDSLDNQMLISRNLKLLGAEVDLANDGLEGIEKATSGIFDVVLMDLQMPRLGGVEATRRLRAKGYERPIVALTAHALQEDRQRCLNVGCTDYLTKPIQRSHLVQVIERVAQLNGH